MSLNLKKKGLYSIKKEGIKITPEWWQYIYSNYAELFDFALQSFIVYVKQYNNNLKLLRLMSKGWGI